MSHLSSFIAHPTLTNLVELYEPIRTFGRQALEHPRSMFSSESHRNPRPDAPFSPDFDLRETTDAYFLEGEFPGISGRGAVKMQWLDGRTLRIEGRIQKLDLSAEWGADVSDPRRYSEQPQNPVEEEGRFDRLDEAGEVILVRGQERKEERENSQEKASALRTWLNERRAGLFVRNFSFPAGLDIDRIQARLSQGLLRVMIPKTRRERFESREIYVQTPDDSLV